jgi:hypothetical protein
LIPLAADEVQKLVQYSTQMEEAKILSSLRLLIEQEWAVRHSANPQIILETLVLELCRLKQLTSVGDLLKQVENGAPVSRNIGAGVTPSTPVKTAPAPSKIVVSETPVSFTPKPSPPPVGEPVLAVDEIEDPAEAEKNPEMAKLKSQWTEFLEKVASQKKMLEGVLRDTRPKHIDEGALILVCKGPFHHEQLSKPENKVLVEKLLEEMLGRKISLVPVLPEGTATATDKSPALRAPKPLSAPKIDVEKLEKEEPIVAAAMKMFGAKIVDVKRNNPQK